MPKPPIPPRVGLFGLFVALAIAAEVFFYRVKDALYRGRQKMLQNDAQHHAVTHTMRVSQWLAGCVTWGAAFGSEDWRKYPLRGLLGALGATHQDTDSEGVAAAALRLCECGDQRFVSLPRGNSAEALAEALSVLSTGAVWSPVLGLDVHHMHAALWGAVGRICELAERQRGRAGSVSAREVTTATVQIVCLAWALEELVKQQ